MWEGMQDALCGKRGKLSFGATPMIDTAKTDECPSGLEPCSTGGSKGGLTYCVSESETCPVTELIVMDADSSLATEYASKQGWST